jgi:hypothetical protein
MLLNTDRAISISGPIYQNIHAKGTEAIPNQNKISGNFFIYPSFECIAELSQTCASAIVGEEYSSNAFYAMNVASFPDTSRIEYG